VTELETPDDPESIYLARLDDVGEHRPTFTGDIYRLGDGHMVMILQHPCALRRGVDLHPRLLVAPVSPDSLRSNWAKAPFGTMPLPKLVESNDHSCRNTWSRTKRPLAFSLPPFLRKESVEPRCDSRGDTPGSL
jgi:hypothetical protein